MNSFLVNAIVRETACFRKQRILTFAFRLCRRLLASFFCGRQDLLIPAARIQTGKQVCGKLPSSYGCAQFGEADGIGAATADLETGPWISLVAFSVFSYYNEIFGKELQVFGQPHGIPTESSAARWQCASDKESFHDEQSIPSATISSPASGPIWWASAACPCAPWRRCCGAWASMSRAPT